MLLRYDPMKLIIIIFSICWTSVLLAQDDVHGKIEKWIAQNQYHEALQYIDSLKKKGDDTTDLLYCSGKASEGVMRYNDAYRYYMAWLNQDSLNREAQIAVARSANLAGRTTEALKRYSQLAAEDTLDFAINFQLGRLYQQTGKPLKAIGIYNRIYAVDSTNITLLKRLGECYAGAGLYPAAILLYGNAFFLVPQNSGLALKAVNLIFTNKDNLPDYLPYATALTDTALLYSPESVALRQSKGMLEYMANRFEKSEQIFTTLINEGDSSHINFKFLGLAKYRQHHYYDASKPLGRADSLFRDKNGLRTDMELALVYAESLGRTRSSKDALRIFNEVEEQLQPDKRVLSQIALLCGMAYAYSSRMDKAKEYYWKAYKLYPKNQRALPNFVNLNYTLLVDDSIRMKASETEIKKALFAHILFLQEVRDDTPAEKETLHKSSRDILRKALEEMFFQSEDQLTVIDPDGKKITYSSDEIRKIINL